MSKMTVLAIMVLGFYAGAAFMCIAVWMDWKAGLLGATGATTLWLSVMGYRSLTET